VSGPNIPGAVLNLLDAAKAALKGDYSGAARSGIAGALDLVPHEEAEVLLTEEAKKRANLAADALEVAKFGDGG